MISTSAAARPTRREMNAAAVAKASQTAAVAQRLSAGDRNEHASSYSDRLSAKEESSAQSRGGFADAGWTPPPESPGERPGSIGRALAPLAVQSLAPVRLSEGCCEARSCVTRCATISRPDDPDRRPTKHVRSATTRSRASSLPRSGPAPQHQPHEGGPYARTTTQRASRRCVRARRDRRRLRDARRRCARDRDRLDPAAHRAVGPDRCGATHRAAAGTGPRQRSRQLPAADGRKERPAAPRACADQVGVRGFAEQARSGARGCRAAHHAGPRGRTDRHLRVVHDRNGVAGRGAIRHPVPQPRLIGAGAHRARPQVVLPRDAQRRHLRRQLLPVLRRAEEDQEDRAQTGRDRRRGRPVRDGCRRRRGSRSARSWATTS